MKAIRKLIATSIAIAVLAPIVAASADSSREATPPSSTDEARAAAGKRYAQESPRSNQAIGAQMRQIARVPSTTDEARALSGAAVASRSEFTLQGSHFGRRQVGVPKGTDEARAMAGERVPILTVAE